MLSLRLEKEINVSTPYGTVLRNLDLPLVDGGVFNWRIASPGAFLYHLCLQSSLFAKFLSYHLDGITSHLALYSDETTAGNVMRWDSSRKVQTFYYTFFELPDWFRSRACGWFVLGFLRYNMQCRIRGGLPCIWKIILEMLFCDLWNLSTGLLLPLGHATNFVIQTVMGCFIQDEKGHKETLDAKGAAGTKMCILCKNCIAGREPGPHEYLKNFKDALPCHCDLHTSASYQAMRQLLDDGLGTLSKGDFRKLEQALGLNYNPDGILWSIPLRDCFDPSEDIYYDSQHTYCSSGGIAQYEVNGFCLELVANDVTLAQLDDFRKAVVLFVGTQNKSLGPKFFQRRVKNAPGAHIRAFANECDSAVSCLCLFAMLMLVPAGAMPLHCESLFLLADSLDILKLGDQAAGYVDELETCQLKHHTVFRECYGDAYSKQKIHYKWHIANSLRKKKKI